MSGPSGGSPPDATRPTGSGAVSGSADLPELDWEMPTSWPSSLDVIFGAAVDFADTVATLSGGRFRITPRPGGELVPALEVLQNVQSGAFPIGHTTGYYYTDLAALTAFGTGLPFGLNDRQHNAWLYESGGLDEMRRIYAERFGIIQFPAGNSGCQMGGWFTREIRSIDDLAGLKMRIPSLGGQVMSRLGVSVQQVPAAEIYEALRTGALDAAEWVGPYDDLNLKLNEVARYYYSPGWWEPGAGLELQINRAQYDDLPELYRQIIDVAATKVNLTVMARYDQLNPEAFAEIEANEDVSVLAYPADVISTAREESFALYDELAAADADFRTLFDSWNAYRRSAARWFGVCELTMMELAARP